MALTPNAGVTNLRFLSPSSAPYDRKSGIPIVLDVSAPTGSPTGSVVVRSGDSEVCVATIADGQATCNANLPLGKHSLTAVFAGDSSFTPAEAQVDGVETIEPTDALEVALNVNVGTVINGATGYVMGENVEPGTEVVLMVYSTPREIARFKATKEGTFSGEFTLPEGLEDGTHRIVATAVSPDGKTAFGDYGFAVNGGQVAKLQPVSATIDVPRSEVIKRYPVFKAAAQPKAVMNMQTQVFALMSVLGGTATLTAMGGSGVLGRRGGGSGGPSGGSSRSGSGSGSGSGAGSGDDSEEASVSAAGADFVEFDSEDHGYGDRAGTWRWPHTGRLDRFSVRAPHRINRFSPLLARVVADATYLRAMFGSLTLLLPVLGLVFGIGAGIDANGTFLPPALAWVLALMVLGVVDAMSGLVGAITYIATTIAIGGLPTKNGAQSTLGLVALWFAPVLLAASARALRRVRAKALMEHWDRGADMVLGPLFGMLGAQGIVFAQNGLSGRKLPISDSATLIAGVVFGCLVLRFGLETLVSYVYPKRLVEVDSGSPDATTYTQKVISLLAGVVLFVLVGRSFFPMVWQFWFSVALFAFGTLGGWDRVTAPLPNSRTIFRFFPSTLVKTVLMIILGSQAQKALEHFQHDPSKRVLDGMVFLALPGLFLLVLSMVGRDGERPEPKWWHRFGGIVLLAIVLHDSLGWFSWITWF